jgi:hypothetical protein
LRNSNTLSSAFGGLLKRKRKKSQKANVVNFQSRTHTHTRKEKSRDERPGQTLFFPNGNVDSSPPWRRTSVIRTTCQRHNDDDNIGVKSIALTRTQQQQRAAGVGGVSGDCADRT